MTATVDTPVPTATPPEPATTAISRRRDQSRHGMLMERAIRLRDQVPNGRRRAHTRRSHSWAQIVVGLWFLTAGGTILYSTGPAWNWIGALAAGVGPSVAMLGVIDLARRGAEGERRVERILRAVRISGVALTVLVIALEVLTTLIAIALLVTAVVWGNWSNEVRYFLVNALVFAAMAGGITMMVRVADLRPVPLTRARWWRELGTFRQFTNIAVPVVVVGAAAALGLRDTRAVAVAMVGLAAVLVGWARVDRTATDEAVRRLAEAADALAAATRAMVAAPEAQAIANRSASHNATVQDALEKLDLACHKNMRGGLPTGPRYLVDIELLVVIRACRAALVDPPMEYVSSPLMATVLRELSGIDPRVLDRELLIFAGDVRRLATLAPDRLVAL